MAWLARRTTTPMMLVLTLVALFGLVLACAVLCGELLELVERPDGSTAIDSSITSWVVAHRTHSLTSLARLLSTIGSQKFLVPVAGAVAVLLALRRLLVPAGLLAAAWGGAIGLYSLTKYLVHRPRPPSDLWLMKVSATSFPSGHATQSLATFVALAVVAGALLAGARVPGKVLAIVLAAGVGWSRVYLGVHWTTDVVAGWLIATAWVAIAIWLAKRATSMVGRLRKRRQT